MSEVLSWGCVIYMMIHPMTHPIIFHPLVQLLMASFASLCFWSACFSSKAEDRLFRKLFRRYNQFIRPVENVSDPVTVEFEVSISQLVKVVSCTRSLCTFHIFLYVLFYKIYKQKSLHRTQHVRVCVNGETSSHEHFPLVEAAELKDKLQNERQVKAESE